MDNADVSVVDESEEELVDGDRPRVIVHPVVQPRPLAAQSSNVSASNASQVELAKTRAVSDL